MRAIDELFVSIGGWFTRLLTETLGVPDLAAGLVGALARALVVCTFAALTFLVLTYLERKIIARIQDRVGPNRVGPFGIFQPIADAIKMFTKEQTVPLTADRLLFEIAPLMAAAPSLMLFAVVPFGRGMVASDMDVGLIYLIAIGSFAEIGILMGGWASRSKYSLLGAMRAVAQMISYEIPMALAFVGLILMTGSLNLSFIVENQIVPFIFLQPLAFLIFLVAAAAESGRSPFDIMEAESELIAGYHTEYAGMQFGLFQMGEFLGFYGQSAIATTLFLGGWQGPVLPTWLWFWLKTWLIVFVFQWAFRGTFPRLRIDQLQAFCWKFLVPSAVLVILMNALLVPFFPIVQNGVRVVNTVPEWAVTTLVYLGANILTGLLILVLYRGEVRRSVAQFEAESLSMPPTPRVELDREAATA